MADALSMELKLASTASSDASDSEAALLYRVGIRSISTAEKEIAVAVPKPGQPVRGSTTGRPLMAALDLFGRRWSLRIVWELNDGPLGFRALQQRCENMSSSVLRQRLTELAEARIVDQLPNTSYALTPLGLDAYQALRPLVRWSARWADQLHADDPSST